ncbi:cyanophycin synthetase [Paraflavisolibacter sp. H34]|uniref:cyanophycin synthetase n=1 Tax=Huijunlia imazamoxiresistens TaxID=3127457 RepID=UPI003018BB51
MKVLALKVLRGPNYWSIKRHNLIQMTLDLEELEQYPTHRIPGFYEGLKELIPTLYGHECSEGVPGGFFSRVKEGTWMGHVIEHIALEIQTLAGIEVGFGRTRGAGKEGVYQVVIAYEEEESGKFAALAAVRIAESLIKGERPPIEEEINAIRRLWLQHKMGPSTASIVQAAARKGIPAVPLEGDSLVQLGYGKKQQRIQATLAGTTSSIGVDLAGNKGETKKLLTSAHIPVARGEVTEEVEKLEGIIEALGFPLVVKPLDGNHGKGATINITTVEDARAAFDRAKQISEKILIEKFIPGSDFRVLLVNYQLVAAARRTPASVTGDGRHTVRQLVEAVNSDPRRGDDHENVLTRIKLDEVALGLLRKKNYTPDTVLPQGEWLCLQPTANLSTGGTATDVTDGVHPRNRLLFERAARTIGLDICGIDIIAPDLETPLDENGGVVLEVNAAPGFRMHLYPSEGKPRDVAGPVVDMLFPHKDNGRIPLIAITGTNGKTTTTRLTAWMARKAGFSTGYCTTDGIYINDDLLLAGDCAGPQSARSILTDRSVEFAVLETARGGILRSGLAFDQCDGAIVTNVAEDHLGLEGIDSLEQLARVKAVVAETVRETGYAVLNADDDLVYAMKDNLRCQVALFSLYAHNIRIERHCSAGGLAAMVEGGLILLRQGNQLIPIEEVANIPLTFNGQAPFNILNVLAACLAAYTNGIHLGAIRSALRTFVPSTEMTPGRMNIFEFSSFKVILDYAHNPHGVRALGQFVRSFAASLKVGVITGVGDRRDEDLIALGEEAARVFDKIIIRHDDDLRGRQPEELDRLLRSGIYRADPHKPITYVYSEQEAVEHALAQAQPDSIIVVLIDHIAQIAACLRRHQEMDRLRAASLQNAV